MNSPTQAMHYTTLIEQISNSWKKFSTRGSACDNSLSLLTAVKLLDLLCPSMQSQCTAVKSFEAEQLACQCPKNIINGCFPGSCTKGPGIRAVYASSHVTYPACSVVLLLNTPSSPCCVL